MCARESTISISSGRTSNLMHMVNNWEREKIEAKNIHYADGRRGGWGGSEPVTGVAPDFLARKSPPVLGVQCSLFAKFAFVFRLRPSYPWDVRVVQRNGMCLVLLARARSCTQHAATQVWPINVLRCV